MTLDELSKIEERAKAALTYERSEYVPEEGMYVSPATEGGDTAEVSTCPLCDGEGSVEGQRYDSKETYASTVVAYGIGKGFHLAEQWVENGPKDALALIAHLRDAYKLLSDALYCVEAYDSREDEDLARKIYRMLADAGLSRDGGSSET